MNTLEKIKLRIDHIPNPYTKSNRKAIINTFIQQAGVKESYDEYDAMKFFDWVNKNYTGQSVKLIYDVIKWLYKVMNFNFSDLPSPEYDNPNVYAMPPEDIKKLILASNTYSLPLKTLIAVSTTYGARRIEMSRITPEDIDLDNSKLFIRTAKSGKTSQRWMYMPDEIKPIMQDYKNNVKIKTVSLVTISAYFWKACELANINVDYNKRLGWHSIRRSLIIALTNAGLNDNTITQYMRWKNKGMVSSILYRYRASQDNKSIINTIDKEVAKVHPFLPFWRMANAQ